MIFLKKGRKTLKNKFLSKKVAAKVLALLLVATFALTGCGKNDNKSNNKTKEPSTEETTAKIKLEGEEVLAQLQSKLNVIDDKNRNYYEIFVASYCDSNGDGMGDLQGIISKLDYLNDGDDTTDTDLGINGIWLMPIGPSASYHKYDVMDYEAIDKAYGTMDDFKKLLEECHKRGITVIIDLVMNHSSIAHPWFKAAKEYLQNLPEGQEPNAADCKYINYYTFVKGNPGGNYYQAGTSDYYYEGMFSQQMPDLNLDNPDVRKEFEDISKFWLDMGVDGFRLDAAKEYFSGDTAKNVEVLTWFNNYVKSVNPEAYIVGETWCADYARYVESGMDSAFDFSYASFDGNIALVSQGADKTYNGLYFANALKTTQDTLAGYSNTAIQASFISNHDLNRPAHYLAFDSNKIKFAHGLLSILNGSTYIYYGDEIGIGGTGADENKRSPMIWSATDTTGQTNGPVNMDKNYVINRFASVEEQEKDDASILSYVKQSLKLRNIFPEIARGSIEILSEVTDEDICAISKTYNDSRIIILANTDKQETKTVTLSRETNGYTCIQGMLAVGEDKPYQVEDTIVLPPNAIVILK